MTKAALKKALKKGLIIVDGKAGNSATWIRGGEEIVLTKLATNPDKKELIFPLKVLYEDEYLAVIHKPAGILVSGNNFRTIVNALPQNLKRSSLPDATTPQPIHRLDFATTGVLMVGKTSSSIRHLNRQFQQQAVAKSYYAISIGEMPKHGTINSKMDDKPVETHYRVLESVASLRFSQLNLLKLDPKTGKRHQIRKHLAGLGNPILGDKDYGKEGLILNGKGLYLHAYSLTFNHPGSKERITVRSELPKRFGKIFLEYQVN